MNAVNELRDDLSYVSAAVKRTRGSGVPSIMLLWAVLIPLGFGLADFAPRWCGLYWLIVGPAGGIASMYLGHIAAKSAGLVDKSLGRRHGMHWLTMFVAYVMVGASALSGHMGGFALAPMFLLLTAVAYTLGGIHLEDSKALLPAGLIMFVGYVILEWLPAPFPWTITGLIVSASLIIAARGAARNQAVV